MAKARSKTAEAYFSTYKASKTWEKNRKRKLERALKEQPNNEQIKAAMGGMVYRRKTPNNREWSATWIRIAKIFKMFEGRFDRNIMSAKPETARAALQRQSKVSAEILRCKKPQEKQPNPAHFFTIAARLGQ